MGVRIQWHYLKEMAEKVVREGKVEAALQE